MDHSNSPELRGEAHPEATEEVVDGQLVRERNEQDRRLDVGLEHSRYTSPLPRPDDLERYAALVPDAPERLLAAGEREQAHRHEVESRLVAIDESSMPKFYEGQRRAHLISLALGLGYEGIMLAVVLTGYPIPGIVGAAAGIGAMIWAVRRAPTAGKTDERSQSDESQA